MAIGSCDCCDRQNVPVSHYHADETAFGETYQCFICQGEDDPDPYGELEGSDTFNEVNGRFGVGA